MCVFYNAHPSSKPAKTRVIVFMETMTWLVSKSEATVLMSSLGFPDSSVGKESACNAGDSGSVPGTGRFSGEGIGYLFQYSWTSLVAELVKNPPAVRETWVRSWIGKIPWRRERLPTPVFWSREFHELYSPWGCKESDMTERLSLLSHIPHTVILLFTYCHY